MEKILCSSACEFAFLHLSSKTGRIYKKKGEMVTASTSLSPVLLSCVVKCNVMESVKCVMHVLLLKNRENIFVACGKNSKILLSCLWHLHTDS